MPGTWPDLCKLLSWRLLRSITKPLTETNKQQKMGDVEFHVFDSLDWISSSNALTSDSSIAHYVDTVYRCLSFTSKSTPSSPGTSSASRSTRSLHGRTKCFTSSSRWSWCTRYLSASSSSRTAQSFTRSHSAVDKRRVRPPENGQLNWNKT